MSSEINDAKITDNIFEKYYLQQANKLNLSSSQNISHKSTKSNLSSSQISNTADINIESTNYFTKCFHNSVVPYLSIKDLINLKKCSKLLNIIINQKAIDICILSNSINKFYSNEYRLSIWAYYMGLNEFTKTLITQYFNKDKESNEIINLNEKEK